MTTDPTAGAVKGAGPGAAPSAPGHARAPASSAPGGPMSGETVSGETVSGGTVSGGAVSGGTGQDGPMQPGPVRDGPGQVGQVQVGRLQDGQVQDRPGQGTDDRRGWAALLAGLPEPVLLVGDDNRIRIANPAALELLGPRLEGQGALLVIRQPEAVQALQRAAAAPNGERHEARVTHTSAAGETTYRMVAHRLSPDAGTRPAATGVLVSFLDVSHVEEAEQMRRDFIANVSHELRSPLTVLSGFIETLQGPARSDPDAQERFLEIMAQEARRMNRLVADLLSLSKVEANERVRPRERVAMGDVVRTTLAALRPLIEENRIALQLDDRTDGATVPGDRDQLVQVVHNLIENALKYGGAGGSVQVRLRAHPRWPGLCGEVLSVAVTDSGEGIDPIHIPRLTERFYRVDSHRSRQMGGTGLGLAIVKHIINRHRGRLVIESERGRGSTFMAVLPCA